MHLADAAYYHAGESCYLCKSQTAGLVDTEVQIDYEGVLAICPGCVLDMVSTAGFRVEDVAEVNRLREELEEHKAARIEAEMVLAELAAAAEKVQERRRRGVRK